MDYVTGEIVTGEIYVASPPELNDIFDAVSLMSSKDSKFYFSKGDMKELMRIHLKDYLPMYLKKYLIIMIGMIN